MPDAFNVFTDGYLHMYLYPFSKIADLKTIIITPHIMKNNVRYSAVSALFSSTVTINIISNITFLRNEGTAISITAGSINILENATLVFKNNTVGPWHYWNSHR